MSTTTEDLDEFEKALITDYDDLNHGDPDSNLLDYSTENLPSTKHDHFDDELGE
jgi:hypothetical protein